MSTPAEADGPHEHRRLADGTCATCDADPERPVTPQPQPCQPDCGLDHFHWEPDRSLVDFLLARIAEDAAVATAVPPTPTWEPPDYGQRFISWESDHSEQDTAFVTRFNPSRILAECEAKRRVVDSLAAFSKPGNEDDWVLCWLATPYADHPDYRSEWRI